MKKIQKTTVEIYHKFDLSLYYFEDSFYMTFFGKYSETLNNKWKEKLKKLNDAEKEREQKIIDEKIKNLEYELSITPESFFNGKLKTIVNELEKARECKASGLQGTSLYYYALEFLSKYERVLISTGDESRIYELYLKQPPCSKQKRR